MIRSRGLIARKHRWSADDDETLRINFPMWPAFLIAYLIGCSVSGLYQRAARLGIKKSPDSWRNPYAHLWSGFRTEASKATRFKPGQVPSNKGQRRPGWAPGRMAATQFKKGSQPQTWVPVGSERVDADGYRWTKVRDDSPAGLARRNWVPNHILLWNEHNGPVPDGFLVVFRDGNKGHVAIENLELIDRAERMRRNTIHNLPPELVGVIRLAAGLRRRIRAREKQAQ